MVPAALLLAILLYLIPLVHARRTTKVDLLPEIHEELRTTTGVEEITPVMSLPVNTAQNTMAASPESTTEAVDQRQVRSAPPVPPRSSLRRNSRWSLFHAV
ncbi:hypothetical protein BD324DRAFT_68782 [Kockovaella imperatae]|uniref:Uncharacterized protein n=1 Tax=Kockovaella imperatae TaxID=4999 RepID=A0A1Y1UCA1_9TREE|nr:hypothetical protein BD324DRAFT_68782 [Kockovaella imperatae]ORX35671.1 hypothetical protein BD324DRAFT_68782 [Kockovaella imperatae]